MAKLEISDRLFRVFSLLVICVLIGILAVLKILQNEALMAAVVVLIYAVIDVFKSAPQATKETIDNEP
jgi:hypothetical protein